MFCDLIAEDKAEWVAKEDRAVAFLPLPESAIAPGQTLVVPRQHCENGVLDTDPKDLAATMALVQRVSRAMLIELGASGVCVLNASGPNSGRSVDHLHFHVVPRYPEDGDDCLPWPAARSTHQVDGDPRELLVAALSATGSRD
ncbi:MAG TPA: HIT domain-containing protein [Nocardioidaceae bacterium]|nr:HIT domain-containing protein [Nocardioidaceae bacterium]